MKWREGISVPFRMQQFHQCNDITSIDDAVTVIIGHLLFIVSKRDTPEDVIDKINHHEWCG